MSFPKIIPFYMYILNSNLLITSPFIPTEINDSKNIIFAETNIPGLNYSPIHSGGFGNRKVSFQIDLIKRNNFTGNALQLKLYEVLRNPVSTLQEVFSQDTQFVQNPKVLFSYGVGSVPLVWYVTKCDFVHSGQYTNAVGFPQFSKINIELTLDETNDLNKIEKVFRQFASIIGSAEAVKDIIVDQTGGRPY